MVFVPFEETLFLVSTHFILLFEVLLNKLKLGLKRDVFGSLKFSVNLDCNTRIMDSHSFLLSQSVGSWRSWFLCRSSCLMIAEF